MTEEKTKKIRGTDGRFKKENEQMGQSTSSKKIERNVDAVIHFLVENTGEYFLFKDLMRAGYASALEGKYPMSSDAGMRTRLQDVIKKGKVIRGGKIVFQSGGRYAHLIAGSKSSNAGLTEEKLHGIMFEIRQVLIRFLRD